MAILTKFLQLLKPEKNDYVDVEKHLSENYDKIDAELEKKASATQLGRIKIGTNLKIDPDGTLHGNPGYTHPSGNGNNHIPANGASGNFLKYLSAGVAQWAKITKKDIDDFPSFGTEANEMLEGVKLAETLGIPYGGILNNSNTKTEGTAYYDSTTKKTYKCTVTNTLNYADASKYEAISNNDLLLKFQNLVSETNIVAKTSVTQILDTVIVFAIFKGKDVQLTIPENLRPLSTVLGQGMATVLAGSLNISCASEFILNSNGICSWVRNIENSSYNGSFGFAYFSYKI